MDDEGDDVAGAEYDGVPLRGEERGRAAQVSDELAEEDVEGSAEEHGRDDESDDLRKEGISVVRALGGPSPGGPSDQFGCNRWQYQ